MPLPVRPRAHSHLPLLDTLEAATGLEDAKIAQFTIMVANSFFHFKTERYNNIQVHQTTAPPLP